jgi:hypothetical protein
LPNAWIVDDETGSINFEVRDELTAATFISVIDFAQAAVSLGERFEPETRKSQPGRSYISCLSHAEVQAANGKQVGRRTEVEVQIDTAHHISLLKIAKTPPALAAWFFNFTLRHTTAPRHHRL